MVAQKGDSIPENTVFKYVPLSDHEEGTLTCSNPVSYNLSKEAQDKKILIVSFPGAFTPACSQQHLPDYLKQEHLTTLFQKGYDKVVCLSANDPFVLQAFAKAYKIDQEKFKREHVIFASDALAEFSKKLGLSLDLTSMGLGVRTGRYVLAVNKGKIEYVAKEPEADVTVTAWNKVYSNL